MKKTKKKTGSGVRYLDTEAVVQDPQPEPEPTGPQTIKWKGAVRKNSKWRGFYACLTQEDIDALHQEAWARAAARGLFKPDASEVLREILASWRGRPGRG